ncbi:hypothetical protein DM860_003567 [Cuscuta australis]|uniref:Uncharacterized protein n=1 Tax=Cuscuta australis TaxID=267555 RepID=A0A328DJP1_9ASTE|nr:hypothetical protein DM860_003567 [Cuscuta australis]
MIYTLQWNRLAAVINCLVCPISIPAVIIHVDQVPLPLTTYDSVFAWDPPNLDADNNARQLCGAGLSYSFLTSGKPHCMMLRGKSATRGAHRMCCVCTVPAMTSAERASGGKNCSF